MDDFIGAILMGYPMDPDELDALAGIAKRTYALYEMLQRVGFDSEQAFELTRIDFTGIVSMAHMMIEEEEEDDSTGV